MASSMELVTIGTGDVLARQGEPCAKFYVLQSGSVAAHVSDEKTREDDAALRESDRVSQWEEQGVIIGAESCLHGTQLDSLIASSDASLLAVPSGSEAFSKSLLEKPANCLAFLRGLARRLIESNESMSTALAGSHRVVSEIEGFFKDFYKIVSEVSNDADGEREILNALSDAKNCKTHSMGQSLSGNKEDDALEMTRMVEAYEMTGSQHKLKKGDGLFREGDKGDTMFIVTKGRFEAYVEGQKACDIEEGDVVGEISVLLGDQPRTADVIAAENSTVAILPGKQLQVFASAQPAIMLQIARSLTRKLESNFAAIASAKEKTRATVAKYFGRDDVDPEKDYHELAAKLDGLIEELDQTELLRPFDQLVRGADRYAAAKARYSAMLE